MHAIRIYVNIIRNMMSTKSSNRSGVCVRVCVCVLCICGQNRNDRNISRDKKHSLEALPFLVPRPFRMREEARRKSGAQKVASFIAELCILGAYSAREVSTESDAIDKPAIEFKA